LGSWNHLSRVLSPILLSSRLLTTIHKTKISMYVYIYNVIFYLTTLSFYHNSSGKFIQFFHRLPEPIDISITHEFILHLQCSAVETVNPIHKIIHNAAFFFLIYGYTRSSHARLTKYLLYLPTRRIIS